MYQGCPARTEGCTRLLTSTSCTADAAALHGDGGLRSPAAPARGPGCNRWRQRLHRPQLCECLHFMPCLRTALQSLRLASLALRAFCVGHMCGLQPQRSEAPSRALCLPADCMPRDCLAVPWTALAVLRACHVCAPGRLQLCRGLASCGGSRVDGGVAAAAACARCELVAEGCQHVPAGVQPMHAGVKLSACACHWWHVQEEGCMARTERKYERSAWTEHHLAPHCPHTVVCRRWLMPEPYVLHWTLFRRLSAFCVSLAWRTLAVRAA